MNETLADKIAKDIRQTGYPVELEVGSVFSEQGWKVHHNRYYIDKDEQKGREIDICAYMRAETLKVTVAVHLVCEVKKASKRPWVIFSTERDRLEGRGWRRLLCARGLEPHLFRNENIEVNSTVSAFSRIGRAYCEAFKGEGRDSRIFRALSSSFKASEDLVQRTRETVDQVITATQKAIYLIEPTVVLDGSLYEAWLGQDRHLNLQEIGHMPVSFGYISPQYDRYSYLIDIVTLKELPRLLEGKAKWASSVSDMILKG